MRNAIHMLTFLFLLLAVAPALQAQPSGELVIALPNDPTGIYIANASDVTAISGLMAPSSPDWRKAGISVKTAAPTPSTCVRACSFTMARTSTPMP